MSELHIQGDPDLPPDVMDALSRDRKLEAIKLLRQSHGIDLKTAKNRIEHYEQTHAVPKRENVEGMITQDRTNTKLIWLAVLAAAGAAAYFWFV